MCCEQRCRRNQFHSLQRAKLGNWKQAEFEAVHEQLTATSLMAFQNCVALDMLLAEKEVGVCVVFGERCCIYLPANAAADGSLAETITGHRTLNGKMKEASGANTSMWDAWFEVVGRYQTLVSSALVSMAVFAAILTLCECRCTFCLRSLFNRIITTAILPMEDRMAQMYPLLLKHAESETESSAEDSPYMYLDPSF